MSKLTKPFSFLYYVLNILLFFIIGLMYAQLIEAGKDQGLAAAAIVLSYGIGFSCLGLILAFAVVYRTKRETIILFNKILSILVILLIGYFTIKYISKINRKQTFKITSPSVFYASLHTEATDDPGLGFFKPKLFDEQVLYFYGQPILDKPLREHSPVDSLVFGPVDGGGFQISYAPPWFQPDHLKLDYDILFLKITGITDEFVEVIVNKSMQKKAYLAKTHGEVIWWPEFLLKVFSIEFKPGLEQAVHIKALEHASLVNVEFEFMDPVMVKGDWVKVRLVNDAYEVVGEGWVMWRKDGVLLIDYSLLS